MYHIHTHKYTYIPVWVPELQTLRVHMYHIHTHTHTYIPVKVPDALDLGQKPLCQAAGSREGAWRLVRLLVGRQPAGLAGQVVSSINSFLLHPKR